MRAPRVGQVGLLLAFVLVALLAGVTLPSLGHGEASLDAQPLPSGDMPLSVLGKDPRRLDVTLPLVVR
jgi:hypothetical protein